MKLNIAIDASGMFYRSLFTVGNYGVAKNEKLLDSRKSQEIFMRKLATDFTSIVRDIENPSRIIVCMDSSSWRKSIIIENGAYKGDREEKKQDSPINWKNFYELTDKFATILSHKGYIVSKLPGAEADDLLFLWSRFLNKRGENVILITGDRDLLQTVTMNKNGTWTVSLDPVNKRKKISLTQETLDSRGSSSCEPDLFNPNTWTTSDDVLQNLTDDFELNIVDPVKIASVKVVLGDGGDAVPSVISWPDKKDPTKWRTMTENNFQKIVAVCPKILNCTWEDLLTGECLEEICSTMEELKKIKVDRDQTLKNIERNCKLVVLSEKIIPEQIQQSFNTIYESVQESIAIMTRDGILSGTEWWSSDKSIMVPKSFDLFGD